MRSFVIFFLSFFFTIHLQLPLAYSEDTEDTGDEVLPTEQITESHWGVGIGSGWIHDYPGAAQGRTRFLVMPVYKGKYLTIDRQDGVKGNVISEGRFKFSVSFSFLFPTDSEDIPVRVGMPDLDWTLQLGPELLFYIVRKPRYTIFLRLPWRFVASTDFKERFKYQGWDFAPSIRSEISLGEGYGELGTRMELEYVSEQYSDYFYQVDPQYATPTRPAYNATAGFMEYILGVSYTYQDFFPWSFIVSSNVYILGDSANRNSPLHVKTRNYSILGAIIRYF